MIDKIIKRYLDNIHGEANRDSNKSEEVRYFKLPYMGSISKQTREKINSLCCRLCKTLKINIAFTSFKISRYFSTKDVLPNVYKSLLVYKFSCPVCNDWYVGYTTRTLLTRICEHYGKDKNSHVLKHIRECQNAFAICEHENFSILDTARSEYEVKIKEALHIKWEKPTINKQRKHVTINLSL